MRIVSGMQAGADRGGADAAMAVGLHVSGYVPKGRLAEDGKVHPRYQCIELGTTSYPDRTRMNVLQAHATLIFTHGPIVQGSGSWRTVDFCKQNLRPYKHVDLDNVFGPTPETNRLHRVMDIGEWFELVQAIYLEHAPVIVNIAGSRESKAPGIQEEVRFLLEEVFRAYRIGEGSH